MAAHLSHAAPPLPRSPKIFWLAPLHSAWLVTFERFDNASAAPPPVSALDGPTDEARGAMRHSRWPRRESASPLTDRRPQPKTPRPIPLRA